ncbi:MAG: MBL fold metallo-hydrolase [Lachnospiraceae bacterium]|nr:MBL fold metallo-hydrolase [Lachnospiraceae bacterium]
MNGDQISVNTQSSIRIAGNKILYFDPFKISAESHDADFIFITHAHYDHLDPGSIGKVMKDDTVFVFPETMKKDLLQFTVRNKGMALKAGDKANIDSLRIHAVPAYNKLKPFHPKRNGWLGYVVTMDETTYYVAGDTDNVKELQDISCDIAFVPIGGTFTMNPKEAAELVNAMRPGEVIPIHYGSIVGTKEDAESFLKLVDKDIQVLIKL